MPGFVERPLLFLDVDGTLVPFGVPPPDGRRGDQPWALPCDLVWATTWMADANEVIAPLLGLPELPMVDWPDSAEEHDGPHWKPRGLVRWAAGRPFVWVDDEITEADHAWVRARHPGHALLRRVDPAAASLTAVSPPSVNGWRGSDRTSRAPLPPFPLPRLAHHAPTPGWPPARPGTPPRCGGRRRGR